VGTKLLLTAWTKARLTLYKEVARLLGVLSISRTSYSFKAKSGGTFKETLGRSN